MKHFITKDMVGEFVQAMFTAGRHVQVDGDSIAVRHSDNSYTFVAVCSSGSIEAIAANILEKERKILEKEALKNMQLKEEEA